MDKISLIYLVGFMGSGKTSVGKGLAEVMGWRFIDLDLRIEEREGRSIRELFRSEGETYFRRVERDELERMVDETRVVVALGGGAFCNEENERLVRRSGASIWLDSPIEILYARCSGDLTRPLFSTREEMEQLLEARRPFYERANLRIETGQMSVEDVVRKILSALGEGQA